MTEGCGGFCRLKHCGTKNGSAEDKKTVPDGLLLIAPRSPSSEVNPVFWDSDSVSRSATIPLEPDDSTPRESLR